MKYLFPIGCIVIFFLCLRFFCKRLRLLLFFKKAARQADAKLRLTSPMFWLPTNRCNHSELLVEGGDVIYAIKVMGLFQRYCDLHFWNAREYSTRKYLLRFQIAQSTPLGLEGGRHKHLNVDFSADLPENTHGKQILCFYLLSPANFPIHITKQDGNAIADLLPGDKIDNIIFTDREYLYQYITLALHQRTGAQKSF